MDILDALMIYESTDEQILGEIRRRLARMRRSCCLSQEELAQRSGVSIATIKRIEGQAQQDISMSILIKLLRSMTQLEGVGALVPKLPDSPYAIKADGTKMTRISSRLRKI